MWDTLWVDVNLATMAGSASSPEPVCDGAVAVAGSNLAFVGPRADLPGSEGRVAREVRECGQAWLTPGLIDCHTHIVYGGNRAHEFEQRLAGASYEEIARAGGGILSTVEATARARPPDPLDSHTPRARGSSCRRARACDHQIGRTLVHRQQCRACGAHDKKSHSPTECIHPQKTLRQ